MFRMVYVADNGDQYISDIGSGLSNIGNKKGVEFFKTHSGIKAFMEVGHYESVTVKGIEKRVWKCDLRLGE